jgi:RNA polymerase sigma-70 factor, ECF subfamily
VLTNPDLPDRIMAVDDDPSVADVVGRYLVRDGHQVEYARDGRTALQRIAEQPPDLVVLDLMLPGIDGLEVCRQLRARWPIPVVRLTALGEETDRVVGLGSGALARVHEMLVRIARSETRRRSRRLRVAGPEMDDLAHQAAADALMAIIAKLGQFRGESRFTTWAYKFVIFEVSAKVGRHYWRQPGAAMAADWGQAAGPVRAGTRPTGRVAGSGRGGAQRGGRGDDRAAAAGLRRARAQRRAARCLAAELGSTRNAIYKTMFDARRKLRAALAANGYLDDGTARRS